MSRNIKHVGQLVNTQRRVVVVFREVPDEPQSCLVVDTDALPDWMHDDVINASESPGAQASSNFYEYAERAVLTDGTNMLSSLHKSGRLQKVPTDNVVMTPNATVTIGLTELNNIIREQTGDTTNVQPDQRDINTLPNKAQSANVAESTTAPEPLDPQEIAKNLLVQAKSFEVEAKALKSKAYDMAPNLKPGPKKPAKVADEPVTSDAE